MNNRTKMRIFIGEEPYVVYRVQQRIFTEEQFDETHAGSFKIKNRSLQHKLIFCFVFFFFFTSPVTFLINRSTIFLWWLFDPSKIITLPF